MIKARSKKDKKGGKKATVEVSFADGPSPGRGSDGEAAAANGDISAPQKPAQMTAEELADEEWGPVKEKGKKGKKGKAKKSKAQEQDEEDKPGASLCTSSVFVSQADVRSHSTYSG